MTKKELLKYLTDCKELELTLYNMEKEQEILKRNMSQLGNVRTIPKPQEYSRKEGFEGCIISPISVVLSVFTAIISFKSRLAHGA